MYIFITLCFKNKMIAVILLGGIGSRLYPLSSKDNPKQFLKLYESDDYSFFQKTIIRFYNCNIRNFVIVLNGLYYQKAKEQVFLLNKNDINVYYCIEPIQKNTCAAVYYACLFIKLNFQIFNDESILVSPSDHILDDMHMKNLLSNLSFDNRFVYNFGVKPNYPETQYGYINVIDNNVISFIEKPDIERANYFILSKNYYWNCGILLFNIETIFDLFVKYVPNTVSNIKITNFDIENNKVELDVNLFSKCENISIDYALIEKINNRKCILFNSYWNDIGNFKSWINEKNHLKDKSNNIVDGKEKIILDDCSNVFIENRTDNSIIMKNVKDINIIFCNKTIYIFKV